MSLGKIEVGKIPKTSSDFGLYFNIIITTMPKKVQRIKDSSSKRKRVGDKLKQKANNPKDMTLREFIESLFEEISDVIAAGYEYEDIAKIMKDEGIEVAASTIRTYLTVKKDNKTTSKKKDNQASKANATRALSLSDDNQTFSAEDATAVTDVDSDKSDSSNDSTAQPNNQSKSKTTTYDANSKS